MDAVMKGTSAVAQRMEQTNKQKARSAFTWVCISSPVTIFPTVRRAGTSTEGEGWLKQFMYEGSCFLYVFVCR
jgi:hypothetical protein